MRCHRTRKIHITDSKAYVNGHCLVNEPGAQKLLEVLLFLNAIMYARTYIHLYIFIAYKRICMNSDTVVIFVISMST